MNLLNGTEFVNYDVGEIELVSTGYGVINKTCGGLMRGGIHLIAGSTGSGKSLFLLHTAVQTALNNQDTNVFYLSFENDPRVDKSRYLQSLKTYNVQNLSRVNNLYFVLDIQDCDDVFTKKTTISRLAKKDESKVTLSQIFNIDNSIIFVDGAEYQMTSASEGSELFKQGKELMTLMSESSKKHNTVIVSSWQLCRGTSDKKIEKLSCDDISMSIAVARIATTIWAIKKSPDNWQIVNIKSRQEVLEEPRAYTLYDKNHHFNVQCQFNEIKTKSKPQSSNIDVYYDDDDDDTLSKEEYLSRLVQRMKR